MCIAFRSAPLTDCSVLAAWPAVPVYGLLRTLTLCSRVRAVDRSAPSLEFRTAHRLLCVRYLTFRPARGLLRVPSSTTGVAHGSLRAQHLEFPVYLGSLRLRLSLRPVPGLLLVRHLALCSTYGLLRTFHSVPCVDRGLLRSLHLLLRAGTFWYSLLNPTNEAVQEFHDPLPNSSPYVSNAVPRLSPGISRLTVRTAYAPFTPRHSEHR